MIETDILIIGAGAVGCATARELSKYNIKVLVLEKNEDIGGGASKSNSAIIHTGYDAPPGTLESELVVAANPMYEKICKNLDVHYKKIGAILPAFTEEQFEKLPSIKEKAFLNKVYDVEYLTKEQLCEMEPNLNKEVLAGLYIPREHIIDTFQLVVGYAENAKDNGVEFMLATEVTDIIVENSIVKGVKTTKGDISAKYTLNCSGLFNDDIAKMIGKANYKVNPRKGQFFILDKETDCKVLHIVLPIPTKVTKGKLICPTVHGNMLVGPTAEDLEDKTDDSTNTEGLESIMADVRRLVPDVNFRDAITQYSGLRANKTPEGLSVDTYEDVKGFINVSGVRSTGITASASLAKFLTRKLIELGMEESFKVNYNPIRKNIPCLRDLSHDEQNKLIKENPLFGRVICRCETVTEGEIVAAIKRPIPALSVDAIKRRLRAGTGRCQGGFCGPKILEIIERESTLSADEIIKSNKNSYMFMGKTRD